MKPRQVILFSFWVLSLVAVTARGSVTFTTQTRSVSANSNSITSTETGLFSATAREAWAYPWEPLEPDEPREYVAEARQDSVLGPYGIVARGTAREGGPFYHGGDYTQSAQSNLQSVFALDEPATFLLTGRLETWGDSGGTCIGWYEASLRLSEGPTSVFSALATAPWIAGHPLFVDLAQTLTLTPGTYTLDIVASAWCPYSQHQGPEGLVYGVGGSGSASYDIQLSPIPAPAALLLSLWGLGTMAFLRRRILR